MLFVQPFSVGRLPPVPRRIGVEGAALACCLLTSCDAALGQRPRSQLPNAVGLTAAQTLAGHSSWADVRGRKRRWLPAVEGTRVGGCGRLHAAVAQCWASSTGSCQMQSVQS